VCGGGGSRDRIAAGNRWFEPSERESLAREFLFHDCDETTLEDALASLDLLETRHLVTEPCPCEAWPSVLAESIVATLDRTLTAGRRITRRMLGRKPIKLAAGHCPQVSRPRRVAAVLERLAQGARETRSGEAS